MKIIAGLGNPGSEYLFTRHNAGFILIDMIAQDCGLNIASEKHQGLFCKGSVWGMQTLLIKPLTYMNESGRCIGQFMRYYKLNAEDLVVIHDDVDLPGGKVKARVGGGDGGHKGIRSIIHETGQTEFLRIKIGVGKPMDAKGRGVKNWVLQNFSEKELDQIRSEVFTAAELRIKGHYRL